MTTPTFPNLADTLATLLATPSDELTVNLAPYLDDDLDQLVEHLTTLRLNILSIRAHRALTERGYRALEPFPGSVNTPWRVLCIHCNTPKERAYKRLLDTAGCICRRGTTNTLDKNTPTRDAELYIAAKGWKSLATYPGDITIPWLLRHACGYTRAITYKFLHSTLDGRCSNCASTRKDY